MNKFSLFLMGYKGFATLKAIIEKNGINGIEAIISARDKNVQKDFYEDIKELCLINNLRFFNRKDNFNLDFSYLIAIGWRWMININNESKIIVLHDSLLPKYRGFAPLVSALINGEKKIGVTAIYASNEYDRGKIIDQDSVSITYPIKINDAIKIISKCYINLAIEIVRKIKNNEKIESTEQNEDEATYNLWLDEFDYRINWGWDSTRIKRFIDSVGYPYKGASTLIDKRKARILDAEIYPDVVIENRFPGKVIFVEKIFPVVVCGNGLLKLIDIVDDESKEKILPLKKFRTRFK